MYERMASPERQEGSAGLSCVQRNSSVRCWRLQQLRGLDRLLLPILHFFLLPFIPENLANF